VLFAAIQADVATKTMPTPPDWLDVITRSATYRTTGRLRDTAIVIDLPSDDGAKLGVALTDHGFRPIPLYNAIAWPEAMVDLSGIARALAGGAEHVAKVPATAPPAFLLDANRMGRDKVARPGRFDNRSVCRASDFPSSERLRQAGIERVLLITEEIQEDLEPIALEWQSSGLALSWKRPSDENDAAALTLRRPWFGVRVWRALFRSAFQLNQDGTYGRMIEIPAAG
jgi:hypothetical protein